ncbi:MULTISPECIES: hypothetical protein [unclassified Streptomyces]|uniref:hypothetical protein n=1 Tax=unclassified Streptomyces TaxID=2593676 RepID=UPI001BEA65EB|nr:MULTISPECIES: hypothetical protein [unclassified Streptomyces]MBT2404449.1 hypothetical protein [Streptomyces sp. ISL-21]MBT2457722.1 hypothetical protein [Streptomyces sp. ISL-86]MBT2612497.1 hypothetical protein [Streptomyces sp. ISL-87]
MTATEDSTATLTIVPEKVNLSTEHGGQIRVYNHSATTMYGQTSLTAEDGNARRKPADQGAPSSASGL